MLHRLLASERAYRGDASERIRDCSRRTRRKKALGSKESPGALLPKLPDHTLKPLPLYGGAIVIHQFGPKLRPCPFPFQPSRSRRMVLTCRPRRDLREEGKRNAAKSIRLPSCLPLPQEPLRFARRLPTLPYFHLHALGPHRPLSFSTKTSATFDDQSL